MADFVDDGLPVRVSDLEEVPDGAGRKDPRLDGQRPGSAGALHGPGQAFLGRGRSLLPRPVAA